jgi:hypothetical protein
MSSSTSTMLQVEVACCCTSVEALAGASLHDPGGHTGSLCVALWLFQLLVVLGQHQCSTCQRRTASGTATLVFGLLLDALDMLVPYQWHLQLLDWFVCVLSESGMALLLQCRSSAALCCRTG